MVRMDLDNFRFISRRPLSNEVDIVLLYSDKSYWQVAVRLGKTNRKYLHGRFCVNEEVCVVDILEFEYGR